MKFRDHVREQGGDHLRRDPGKFNRTAEGSEFHHLPYQVQGSNMIVYQFMGRLGPCWRDRTSLPMSLMRLKPDQQYLTRIP